MQALPLLKQIVEMAGGVAERGYVLAFDSEGMKERPETLTIGSVLYHVRGVETELGLRRLLVQMRGAPLIVFVPRQLGTALPFDLLRRARASRVHSLEVNDVLQVMLGVATSGIEDPETQQLALGHLEALRVIIGQRTLPTVIDRSLLDELLLEACVGARIRAATPARLLAEWLKQAPRWEPAVAALVRRSLPRLHGTEGRILAWALQSRRRLASLVERGVLLAIEGDMSKAVWGELDAAIDDKDVGLTEEVVRATVARLATEALDELDGAALPLLTEGENVARRLLTPAKLAQSTLLPLGLETRCLGIAERAAGGEPVAGSEVEWITRHHAAAAKRSEVAMLAEMARLARWHAEPEVSEDASVEERVRHYQDVSAFADLAVARLRRAMAASGAWHEQAKKVLERWRQRRDRENLGFARSLAGGYVRALHGPELVPLHRVFPDVALREDQGARRTQSAGGLYLVVLDGCSYPVFLELLYDLAQAGHQPIGIGADARRGRAAGIPALAPLPTITSHARGALFLGQIPKDPWLAETAWREGGERTTDPARFKQNPSLGTRSRRLFLKGDLTDGGQALRAALEEPGLDVVATVFNAIDDQIGSANTGAAVQVKADQIAGFVPSLQTALRAGRRVLVVADHGHAPFWGTDGRVGAAPSGSPPRYRVLKQGETAPEGFLEVDLEGLGGTPGRMAFAWRVGAYQGSPQVGFHGGCSLEEMVVPMAWLVDGGVPADEPAWWHGSAEVAAIPSKPSRASRTEPPAMAAPAAPVTARARPVQVHLFDARPTVDALAADVGRLGLEPAVVERLDAAERAALVTLHANGSARSSDLSAAIGKLPERVGPFMTQLHRKLHRAGSPCFRAEPLPTGETQYRWTRPRNLEGR